MTLAASLLTALVVLQSPPQTPPVDPPQDQATPAPVSIPLPEEEEGDVTALVVQGIRPRGSVTVDIDPEVTLDAADIQALGGNNIGEILERLGGITASSRGRGAGQPIILLNGRRTTGYQEVRTVPSEAIERVEVLPEEVALSYGYAADQKVTNFVLKQAFRQASSRVEAKGPMQGGSEAGEFGGNFFAISKGDRWNFQLEYERENALFEDERDIIRDPGGQPFDLTGNVAGIPFGNEIDPALSGLAGQTVIIAAVPSGAATPGVADFAGGANAPRRGDLGTFRTLSPELERAAFEGSVAHDLDGNTQATLSVSLEDRSTTSYLGLPGLNLILPTANPYSPFAGEVQLFRYVDAPDSLMRTSDSLNAKAAVVVDGYIGNDWRWTFSGDYSRVESDTRTGRGLDASSLQARLTAGDPALNPFGPLTGLTALSPDTANSVSQVLSAEVVLNGDLYELPAGPIQATFSLGYDNRSLDSVSVRSGLRVDRALSRDRFYGKGNFTVPLVNRDEGPVGWLGSLSVNANADYYEASDFGGLFNVGGGVNWSFWEPLNLSASYSQEHAAPDIGQLNDPIVATPNVPVFDFAMGQTVLVTRITGGNLDLAADTRQVARFGVNYRPFKERELFLNASYTWSSTDDAISAFPTLTPDVEAALPSRFTRDASGRLLSIDARALNFARTERRDLRTSLFYSVAFGKPTGPPPGTRGEGRPGGRGGRPGGGEGGPRVGGGPGAGPRGPGGPVFVGPGGGGGRPGGGGGGPRMGGRGGGGRMNMLPGQGRVFFNLSYVHRFQDEIEVAPGLPIIDQLNGQGAAARRQELQGGVGVFKDGNNAFLNFNWRAGTRIDGGAAGSDLTFGDYTIVNLNLSTDLSQRPQLMKVAPWLKGTQLQLNIQNLFDEYQDVRSSAGTTPLNYQRDFLDPNGRYITFRIRKVLF